MFFNVILKFSITYRYVVCCITFLLGLLGVFAYDSLVIDAVPDITNVQVQINTEAQGYSPFEIEQRVTVPLEYALSGLPKLDYTRSLSRYGLSQITVVFKDGTDIYLARQLVSQRLQEAKEKLPSGVAPTLGPIATGLGEIFMYVIENDSEAKVQRTLQELREVQDWLVRPQLRTVQGVVEVNSIGGASKQIVISPYIEKLASYNITLSELSQAIEKSNSNVGAGFIENNGEQFLIRAPAQVTHYKELEQIIVSVHEGIPIRIKDVASVVIGSELRAGAATEDGKEVVLATVFMLIGENGRDVANRVKDKIAQITPSLPEGVVLKTLYDRSDLVQATIATVKKNLIEGAVLVIVILCVALGNLRAALITACVIPLSMLMTIMGMVKGGMSANLMSLGALDFGLIVDGAVILVENCIKRFSEAQKKLGRNLTREERLDLVYTSSTEVRQASMFGELIIMVVYIPILLLTGIEGKMYHPMASTVLLALGAALILSLTFVPAAVTIFLTGAVKEHPLWLEKIQNMYARLLTKVIKMPRQVVAVAVCILCITVFLFNRLGSEFIPSLDEGDVALHAMRIPGTSLTQSIQMQHHIEAELKKMPEIKHVFAKMGTAEVATDPMPPSIADGYIILNPRDMWDDPRMSKAEVVQRIEDVVHKIPGNNYEFTQPIQMRFNELIAGVRSDVAVKVFGDDPKVLQDLADKIEKRLSLIQGAADIKIEQTEGLPMIQVLPRKDKIAQLGIQPIDIQEHLHIAYAGKEVSRYYEGDRYFPIVVRLSDDVRSRIEHMKKIPLMIPLQGGAASLLASEEEMILGNRNFKNESIPRSVVELKELADILITEGPNQISRENGKRRIVVTANVRDRDLGSFVEEAQKVIKTSIVLPANYWYAWGGQYENLISAKNRLLIVVPLVLLSVFGLIYLTLQSLSYTCLVFTAIPFAMTGGVFGLWLRDIPFSISAAIGFIALSGVSVLNSLVLVSFIKNLIRDGIDIQYAVINGSVMRLRPVLMTALVASLGFLPMAFSQGTGSEVQRPLATVVIGGIMSSTILTLLVLPSLIAILRQKKFSNS